MMNLAVCHTVRNLQAYKWCMPIISLSTKGIFLPQSLFRSRSCFSTVSILLPIMEKQFKKNQQKRFYQLLAEREITGQCGLKMHVKAAQQKGKGERKKTCQAASQAKDKEKTEKGEESDLNGYFQIRSQTIEKMKLSGENPYPHKFDVSISLTDFISKYDNLGKGEILNDVVVSVAGRILSKRESGKKLIFYDLRDEGVKIQVMASTLFYSKEHHFWKINGKVRRGDIIGCVGHPGKTKKGELSIMSTSIQMLAPCLHMLPVQHFGLKNKDTKFTQWLLHYITNEQVMQRFITRERIIKYIRQFLSERGLIEVQTPILSTSPSGATAKQFVVRHNKLDIDLYLRVSPELCLKMLVIGGFERIFEIGKSFRNEGLDSTHFPEFTTCEFYITYTDYNDLMQITESLFSGMVKTLTGSYKIVYHPDGIQGKAVEIDFTPPYKRIKMIPGLEAAMGEKLPEPHNMHLPEANKLLSDLCVKYEVKCSTPRTTARLLDKLACRFLEQQITNPTFLCDHPEVMSPLAKSHRSVPGLTERFEMIVMKTEIVDACTELSDPVVQRSRFERQALDNARHGGEAKIIDEDYCACLEYGLPPTGGWGMGIDRFVMLMTDANHIKDVLWFPYICGQWVKTKKKPKGGQTLEHDNEENQTC